MLTLFILCYNRHEMAVQAIRSVADQGNPLVRLIVSDNSTIDGLAAKIMDAGLDGVELRRRSPSVPAFAHMNICMDEVETPYFMLFHDDDLLLPGALEAILEALVLFPQAMAIGLNARVERSGAANGTSFVATSPSVVLDSPQKLFRHYFGKGNSGIAPFPGYTYLTRIRDRIRFSDEEGKYSDVAFLMRVVSIGPIVWLSQPLMVYRLHANNDSNTESRKDRLRFLAFLKGNPGWIDANGLVDYRYFIFKRLADQGRQSTRRIRKNLRMRRFLRKPDFAGLPKRLWLVLTGTRKGL